MWPRDDDDDGVEIEESGMRFKNVSFRPHRRRAGRACRGRANPIMSIASAACDGTHAHLYAPQIYLFAIFNFVVSAAHVNALAMFTQGLTRRFDPIPFSHCVWLCAYLCYLQYYNLHRSRIAVVAMTGAAIVIDDASTTDTILSVKERVFAANPKLPVHRQRLMYRPGPHGIEPLPDFVTLGGAGVAQDGSAELDILLLHLTEEEATELGEKVRRCLKRLFGGGDVRLLLDLLYLDRHAKTNRKNCLLIVMILISILRRSFRRAVATARFCFHLQLTTSCWKLRAIIVLTRCSSC